LYTTLRRTGVDKSTLFILVATHVENSVNVLNSLLSSVAGKYILIICNIFPICVFALPVMSGKLGLGVGSHSV
jgi:hypothetical protein